MRISDKCAVIQVALRRRTLDLRAIDRLIQGPEFPSMWENGTSSQKVALLNAIKHIDHDKVRELLGAMQKLDIRDLTKRELIYLARKYSIKNYSRKSKTELVRELIKRGIDDKAL